MHIEADTAVNTVDVGISAPITQGFMRMAARRDECDGDSNITLIFSTTGIR